MALSRAWKTGESEASAKGISGGGGRTGVARANGARGSDSEGGRPVAEARAYKGRGVAKKAARFFAARLGVPRGGGGKKRRTIVSFVWRERDRGRWVGPHAH
jgi:hypothetical protein